MDTDETEWQFDAVDLSSVRRALDAEPDAQISPDAEVTHTDLYLDTDDHRLYRAGYALRIRRVGRRRSGEATLKSVTSADKRPGPLVRREITQPLARADIEPLVASDGPVAARIRAVAGRKRLRPLFTIRTHRRSFSIAPTINGARGVLALDESTITPATGTKRTRLRRVEVEVDGDEPDGLAPFVERLLRDCKLQPATYSKYEAALLVTDIQPQMPELGLTRIDPRSSTVGEVALAVVRRHFAALLAHEPGTRLGDDSEELHDMRVASRRLRAALSLFADVLPQRVLRGEDDLRWVGGTLGEVRDLDVQLEQLAQWLELSLEPDRAALEPLRERLEHERASARTRMLESLDSRRYESFVKSFRRALLGRPPRGIGPWREPVLAAAPPLIEGRFHTFAKAGKRIEPTSAAAEYHRLRIRGKRLRYALEFFADAYPDEAGKLIKRLVALQDILGLNQDAEVAIARLRALASDAEQNVDKTTVFAMGEIAERYRRETVALRKRVPAAYAKVVGKSWRTLEKAMLRERDHPVGMTDSGGGSGSVPAGAG